MYNMCMRYEYFAGIYLFEPIDDCSYNMCVSHRYNQLIANVVFRLLRRIDYFYKYISHGREHSGYFYILHGSGTFGLRPHIPSCRF